VAKRESNLSNRCRIILKELGVPFITRVLHTSLSGVPDMLMTYNGRLIWVEMKTINDRVRDSQALVKTMTEPAGVPYFILHERKERRFEVSYFDQRLDFDTLKSALAHIINYGG
jgi:hypothetical protein